MDGVLFAPHAVLFELKFFFHATYIFMRVVIVALAHTAPKTYKIWLWHDYSL